MSSSSFTVAAPFLPVNVAVTLHKSSGYVCRGQIDTSTDGETVVEVNSVEELLRIHEDEKSGTTLKLPQWAVQILKAAK